MENFFNFVNSMEIDPFIINLQQQYFELLLSSYIKKHLLHKKKPNKTHLYNLFNNENEKHINININLNHKPAEPLNESTHSNTQPEPQLNKPNMPDIGDLNFDLFLN